MPLMCCVSNAAKTRLCLQAWLETVRAERWVPEVIRQTQVICANSTRFDMCKPDPGGPRLQKSFVHTHCLTINDPLDVIAQLRYSSSRMHVSVQHLSCRTNKPVDLTQTQPRRSCSRTSAACSAAAFISWGERRARWNSRLRDSKTVVNSFVIGSIDYCNTLPADSSQRALNRLHAAGDECGSATCLPFWSADTRIRSAACATDFIGCACLSESGTSSVVWFPKLFVAPHQNELCRSNAQDSTPLEDQLWWPCVCSRRASVMEQTTSNNLFLGLCLVLKFEQLRRSSRVWRADKQTDGRTYGHGDTTAVSTIYARSIIQHGL